jgi:hypothetical protein
MICVFAHPALNTGITVVSLNRLAGKNSLSKAMINEVFFSSNLEIAVVTKLITVQ